LENFCKRWSLERKKDVKDKEDSTEMHTPMFSLKERFERMNLDLITHDHVS
jgi:hypothetical protein